MLENSVDLKTKNLELDVGVKACLAVLLAVASSFCGGLPDFLIFSIYLMTVTVLLKSNLKFILKNLISYGIIFIIPYFLGLYLSVLVSRIFAVSSPVTHQLLLESLNRMGKVFFVWYIGSLYFFTTPLEEILVMLNTVLSPLNARGIHVLKYLNMMMCILNELADSISQFKMDILEKARQIFKNRQLGLKVKLDNLANILVSFIANSLQKTDDIQKRVENMQMDAYIYKMRISRNESLAILSFIVLLFLLWK